VFPLLLVLLLHQQVRFDEVVQSSGLDRLEALEVSVKRQRVTDMQ
jgi:hypothetical protein